MQYHSHAFIRSIKAHAQKNPQRIVFPESDRDPRILAAVIKIVKEKTAKPFLYGKKKTIENLAKKNKINMPWKKVTLIEPTKKTYEKYAQKFCDIRKKTGIQKPEAEKIMHDPNYFCTMMVAMGDADGLIGGSLSTTGETVRPALQIIPTKEKFHKVSGFFFMVLDNRLLLFADCAITIDPNSHDLAGIAIDTAETAKRFGIEPRVALLSFSTKDSAQHPYVTKVREAVAIIKEKQPKLLIDGELQVDAAIIPEIAEKKCPTSPLKGTANVLIFPDLQSGNIAYKLVERLAGATAIGPILQGLCKPINDLSRGCSIDDIVTLTAITSIEAAERLYPDHCRC